MSVHSIPGVLATSLLLLSTAAAHMRHAELYLEIHSAPAGADGRQLVDVIVGNRGDLVSHDNFDAVLLADRKGTTVCRATTNFVTPIGPGESISALRLEVVSARSGAAEAYTIRASIQPWDFTRGAIQKQTVIALSPGAATCIALKPVQ